MRMKEKLWDMVNIEVNPFEFMLKISTMGPIFAFRQQTELQGGIEEIVRSFRDRVGRRTVSRICTKSFPLRNTHGKHTKVI